jgi:hypothetical protein
MTARRTRTARINVRRTRTARINVRRTRTARINVRRAAEVGLIVAGVTKVNGLSRASEVDPRGGRGR